MLREQQEVDKKDRRINEQEAALKREEVRLKAVEQGVSKEKGEVRERKAKLEGEKKALRREKQSVEKGRQKLKETEKKVAKEKQEVARLQRKRLLPPRYWAQDSVKKAGASFAMVGISDQSDAGLWRTLSSCLATVNSQWLGHGRDVVERGNYSRLELTRAWRIQNTPLWERYTVAQERMKEDLKRVGSQRRSVNTTLQAAARNLPASLLADVNEVGTSTLSVSTRTHTAHLLPLPLELPFARHKPSGGPQLALRRGQRAV